MPGMILSTTRAPDVGHGPDRPTLGGPTVTMTVSTGLDVVTVVMGVAAARLLHEHLAALVRPDAPQAQIGDKQDE